MIVICVQQVFVGGSMDFSDNTPEKYCKTAMELLW